MGRAARNGLWTVLAGLVLVPAAAGAGALDVGVEVVLGMAGEAEADADGDRAAELVLNALPFDENNMEATAGLGLFVMYEVWDYIDIGGTTGFLWWRTDSMEDDDVDHSFLWDFDFRLKGKYDGILETEALEVYGTFSIGLTVAVPNEDLEEDEHWGNHETQIDVGVGLNAAASGGVSYLVIPEFGVFAELGWTMHWATNEVDIHGVGSADLTWSFHQFGLNVGCYYSAL